MGEEREETHRIPIPNNVYIVVNMNDSIDDENETWKYMAEQIARGFKRKTTTYECDKVFASTALQYLDGIIIRLLYDINDDKKVYLSVLNVDGEAFQGINDAYSNLCNNDYYEYKYEEVDKDAHHTMGESALTKELEIRLPKDVLPKDNPPKYKFVLTAQGCVLHGSEFEKQIA